MRKIKFRGKCISPKYEDESIYLKWIYGDLHHVGNEYFIYCDDGMWHEVDKDTIGQYAGVKDKNEKEIYDGDIVEFYNDVDYIVHPGIAKVIFDLGAFQMENEKYGTDYLGNMDIDDMGIRVIGNIYENPDLLKSKIEGEINGKSI